MKDETILIEGGDMFEGNWAMLADCFGITDIETLYAFCSHEKYEFEIKPERELTVSWSECDWQPACVK